MLTQKEENKYSFFYENDVLTELDVSKEGQESLVGNIYVGQVKNIQPNIQAAFVAFCQNRNGFLPLADFLDKNNQPKMGDSVVIQIDKDAVKTKDPVLTTKLSLKGEYCVVQLFDTRIGFSGKLSTPRKNQLKSILEDQFLQLKNKIKEEYSLDIGIIVRTSCEETLINCEEILNEASDLCHQLVQIYQLGKSRTLYSTLYEAGNFWTKKYEHFKGLGLDEIITDQKECFELLQKEKSLASNANLRFYQDEKYPLAALYSLTNRIQEATEKKVWLKCGGYLVIEETEALTVIDVNSGKNICGKDKEATFEKINLEAANECARQCRLRNFNGIIIIDFINCKDNTKFIKRLKEEIKKDPIKTSFVDITPLGLVEITRQKKTRPLSEKLRG